MHKYTLLTKNKKEHMKKSIYKHTNQTMLHWPSQNILVMNLNAVHHRNCGQIAYTQYKKEASLIAALLSFTYLSLNSKA